MDRTLWMNDIQECPTFPDINIAAEKIEVNVSFVRGDDLLVPLPNPVDFTFIDTWHVFGQLKRELSRYDIINQCVI